MLSEKRVLVYLALTSLYPVCVCRLYFVQLVLLLKYSDFLLRLY